ncbi:putative ATP-grasp superfamily ATP-dependent carboligase [Actinomycetospora succinea]|uniref:Putative ATP-grasp superfamily ATP-dependent carboligase n=1 Tax=Actinomycetospora succinea TaxID=663603 RepID=A0A4R6UT42_9PSEU|nr:ATP-grasp domain-containing protein [Actinomycetospora succinea]TDQ48999.1 putative ATP-grasp superfamily ATP-dependent carboligase [Actinomycetospora succinea]
MSVVSSPRETTRHSRHVTACVTAPDPADRAREHVDALLRLADSHGPGVVVPTTDEALEAVSAQHDRLAARHLVACPTEPVARTFLDKRITSEVAERAGVEAPRTVSPGSYDELELLIERLRLPCLVKPAESYRYNRAFGVKMKRVHTPDELRTAWGEAHELGIGTMVQELIPGPETGGVNYNVYVAGGEPRVEMTSCKLRLSPRDFGYPSAVVSRYVGEVIEPGRAIVAAMGIEGFANVEFKQDERDGRYKLMEVNGRPNMSGRLAVRCGVDFPLMTYRHLVHGEMPAATPWPEGVHWVNEFKDTRIVLDRWRDGRLPWLGGLKPYLSTGVFGTFDARDPRPFLARVRDGVATPETKTPAVAH